MSDWDSEQYLKFRNERTQPAADLAARIKQQFRPASAADVGCGPGNSTKVLHEAFPEADILGIDASPAMIKRAASELPELKFRLCDARSLRGKYDLIFSNACLQWVPDHASLIPTLAENLNAGGMLAVQIPMNDGEPLFRLIHEIAAEQEWGMQSRQFRPFATLTPEEYFSILSGCFSSFNMWETVYYHCLPGHDALVEWVRSTKLRPYLDFLGRERAGEFEAQIAERSRALYPVMDGGKVVLRFRRFFFTAVKQP